MSLGIWLLCGLITHFIVVKVINTADGKGENIEYAKSVYTKGVGFFVTLIIFMMGGIVSLGVIVGLFLGLLIKEIIKGKKNE